MADEYKPWEQTLPSTDVSVLNSAYPSTTTPQSTDTKYQVVQMSDAEFNERVARYILNRPLTLRLGQNNQVGTADINNLINSYIYECVLVLTTTGGSAFNSIGYEDANGGNFAVAMYSGANARIAKYGTSGDFGTPVFLKGKSSTMGSGVSTGGHHVLTISSDYWICNTDGGIPTINKNGTGVTISGTQRFGPLGIDPVKSYLLVLYSTTKIARFTGYSGTTITNANSDITLDTAVTQTGFVFDAENQQYVCVDATNNRLIKFNSVGQSIQTLSYTIDDSNLTGAILIGDRYYMVLTTGSSSSSVDVASLSISIIPTTMQRG